MKKRGRVKIWNDRHGNGDIEPDDGGPSLYFHAAGVVGCGRYKNLLRGQFVEYEIGVNHVGPLAFNVRPLRPEEVTAE